MRFTLWENVKFKRPVVIDEEGNIYELSLVGHVQMACTDKEKDTSSTAYVAKSLNELDKYRSTPKYTWEDKGDRDD